MFNVGPLELIVLAIVGIVVIGPEKLPGLARDAARLLRTLRDLATGAREQIRDELGPEFADVDLRNLNPRTAVSRAIFGDELDFNKLNPRNALRDAVLGDEDLRSADPRSAVRETRDAALGRKANGGSANGASTNGASANGRVDVTKPVSRPDVGRARPRPRPATPYDDDIT